MPWRVNGLARGRPCGSRGTMRWRVVRIRLKHAARERVVCEHLGQSVKLLDILGNRFGVLRQQHVFLVGFHGLEGPVERAGGQLVAIYYGKLVMHVFCI